MAYQPVTLTADTTLVQENHANTPLVLDKEDGLTATLPASSGGGDSYTFFVVEDVTSNSYKIQVANSTDVINGGLAISTDIAGVTMLAAATSDTITMNGSTKGGLQGSWVRLTDVSAGFWMLEGFLCSSGSETSPFSAAV